MTPWSVFQDGRETIIDINKAFLKHYIHNHYD